MENTEKLSEIVTGLGDGIGQTEPRRIAGEQPSRPTQHRPVGETGKRQQPQGIRMTACIRRWKRHHNRNALGVGVTSGGERATGKTSLGNHQRIRGGNHQTIASQKRTRIGLNTRRDLGDDKPVTGEHVTDQRGDTTRHLLEGGTKKPDSETARIERGTMSGLVHTGGKTGDQRSS